MLRVAGYLSELQQVSHSTATPELTMQLLLGKPEQTSDEASCSPAAPSNARDETNDSTIASWPMRSTDNHASERRGLGTAEAAGALQLSSWPGALNGAHVPDDFSAAATTAMMALLERVTWRDVTDAANIKAATSQPAEVQLTPLDQLQGHTASQEPQRDEVALLRDGAQLPRTASTAQAEQSMLPSIVSKTRDARRTASAGQRSLHKGGSSSHIPGGTSAARNADIDAQPDATCGGTEVQNELDGRLQELQTSYSIIAQADLSSMDTAIAQVLQGAMGALPAATVSTLSRLVDSYTRTLLCMSLYTGLPRRCYIA